ncbi:MAG: hypothetical protein EAX87_14525 [Candidatus Thorarchaeota archaeon]|nr:hypothetical protein [Candidatus Thorarchaeota archaeon]
MGFFSRLKTPKASIAVLLDKGTFSLNEPLQGRLEISSSEEFDADELRIEVRVNEWTKATQQKTVGQQQVPVTAEQNNVLHQGKLTVAGGRHFTDGTNESIPFSLSLPSSVPPTYRSQNARNTWVMKGVIGVKGRPDVTSHEMEVVITY